MAGIVITRLQIPALFDQLKSSDRPLVKDINTLQVIYRGIDTVERLVFASRSLAKGKWPVKNPIG